MKKAEKILVVEDERIVAEDIRRNLQKLGYEVAAVASSGEEALLKARQLNPDLILMDIVLSRRMNGIQTAEKIHDWNDIPIVYLTAYADAETLDRAKKTQPYGYLLKPFENRELQTTIEMALYKHRTERQIKESEAWLSTMLKSIAEAVVATNDRGEILFMNPVAEVITGASFKDVHGKRFDRTFRLIRGEKEVADPVSALLTSSGRAGISTTCQWIRLDGRPVHVDLSASPIRQENGKVLGVVLAFQDITPRIETEAALRQSEQEKRLILSTVSDLVIYVDTEFKIIWANEAVGRAIGKDPDQLRGKPCRSIWREKRHLCRHCPARNSLGTQPTPEIETESENGSIWISKIYPVRNDAGVLTGAVEVLRDITLQKQAEEQLQKEKEFIDTLIQVSPAFYTALDDRGRIRMMNETMLRALGYKHEDVINTDFLSIFIHPDDRPLLSEWLIKTRQSREPLYGEFRMLSKDGRELAVEWHGRSVMDKKGNFEYSFGLALDTTERRIAMKDKERVENQLQQIQKMEAIGTLTGGVAHDFNNLLTAIQGCAEMAMLRLEPGNSIHHDLQEILTACGRASELTRQLLLFSSRHPTKFMPLDVNKVIDDLLKMLHRLLGEDVGISTVLYPRPWTVRGDKGTLEQVLMNLTVNARDAMPKGGKITIRTDNVEVDQDYCIEYPEARPGEFVRISVADTGTGIDQNILPRIFEPFFSTKAPGKGTGLGLSVVYGIVRQHSGWITVSSQQNKGAVFDVYIPAVKDRMPQPPEVHKSAAQLMGHGERILVVEDAVGIREFLRAALREHGYMVFMATGYEEALLLFEKQNRDFDLLFSDVVLPDKSGVDLVDALSKIKPDLKVLLSSGYTDQKSQWKVIQNKKIPFLQKPYSLTQLLTAISEALQKS
jgi:two-component system, cell cycle sensor histidine kinase and response regulator CckA